MLLLPQICGFPPGKAATWTQQSLAAYKAHIESFGLVLDMIQLPLSSAEISSAEVRVILDIRQHSWARGCSLTLAVTVFSVPTSCSGSRPRATRRSPCAATSSSSARRSASRRSSVSQERSATPSRGRLTQTVAADRQPHHPRRCEHGTLPLARRLQRPQVQLPGRPKTEPPAHDRRYGQRRHHVGAHSVLHPARRPCCRAVQGPIPPRTALRALWLEPLTFFEMSC